MRKYWLIALVSILATAAGLQAGVRLDEDALGKSLGGWKKRGKSAAEYPLSGSTYRTYKPEITQTPEKGLFVSLRIDHVRGWLSSDDHAILEVTIDSKGSVVSAKSTIAIQGRSISSDLIVGVNESGKKLAGADLAVQIGSDLVANLTSKLLREKVVEAGRVSFPAVLRHNYNLLYQVIRSEPDSPPAPVPSGGPAATPAVPAPQPEKPKDPAPSPAEPDGKAKPSEIKPEKPVEGGSEVVVPVGGAS